MEIITKTIQAMQKPPHRLTQTEIAGMTGMHQAQVSKWGAGKVPISARQAARLLAVAERLGINKIASRRRAR